MTHNVVAPVVVRATPRRIGSPVGLTRTVVWETSTAAEAMFTRSNLVRQLGQ